MKVKAPNLLLLSSRSYTDYTNCFYFKYIKNHEKSFTIAVEIFEPDKLQLSGHVHYTLSNFPIKQSSREVSYIH